MKSYNALIIEANATFVRKVRHTLACIHVQIVADIPSLAGCREILRSHTVDIILSNLEPKSGQLAHEHFATFDRGEIPLIYYTSHSDVSLYEAAMATRPESILVRPFSMLTFRNAVENALGMHASASERGKVLSIYVKKKRTLVKLLLTDITWVVAEGNYCHIHSVSEQYVSKISLKRFCQSVDPQIIVRIHRNFAVNRNAIDSLDFKANVVQVADHQLPIGRSYKTSLREMLNTI